MTIYILPRLRSLYYSAISIKAMLWEAFCHSQSITEGRETILPELNRSDNLNKSSSFNLI